MNDFQNKLMKVLMIVTFAQESICGFVNLYSFFYAINHVTLRERSLSTMLGSLTSVLILELMSRGVVIELAKKYGIAMCMVTSALCGFSLSLLPTNPLATLIINATFMVISVRILMTVWSDYENSVFVEQARTIFSNRNNQMAAAAGLVSSGLCYVIGDVDINTIVHISLIVVITMGIMDVCTLQYLKRKVAEYKELQQ